MDILADLDGVRIVRATRDHIGTIERLLADDPTSPKHVPTTTLTSDDLLGECPEDADLEAAFDRIQADPNQALVMILDDMDHTLGTLQISFLPTLARGGGVRAVVTSARIRAGADSIAIGRRVFGWAVEYAREQGARVLVVITDKNRAHIHGFFTTMGFRSSHDGLVLPLTEKR